MPKSNRRKRTSQIDYTQLGEEQLLDIHKKIIGEKIEEIQGYLGELPLQGVLAARELIRDLASNYSQRIDYNNLHLDEIMEEYERTGEDFTTSELLEKLTQQQPELLDKKRRGILTPRSLATHISHLKKRGPPYNRIVETGRTPTNRERVYKIQSE